MNRLIGLVLGTLLCGAAGAHPGHPQDLAVAWHTMEGAAAWGPLILLALVLAVILLRRRD